MSFCHDAGIPHSEFLDWAPEDQAKEIAFQLEKNTKCSLCGTAEWEWDPKQGGSRFAYEAVAHTCRGCEMKDAVSDETGRRPGTTIELHPTGTVESAKRLMAAKNRQKKSRKGR